MSEALLLSAVFTIYRWFRLFINSGILSKREKGKKESKGEKEGKAGKGKTDNDNKKKGKKSRKREEGRGYSYYNKVVSVACLLDIFQAQ